MPFWAYNHSGLVAGKTWGHQGCALVSDPVHRSLIDAHDRFHSRSPGAVLFRSLQRHARLDGEGPRRRPQGARRRRRHLPRVPDQRGARPRGRRGQEGLASREPGRGCPRAGRHAHRVRAHGRHHRASPRGSCAAGARHRGSHGRHRGPGHAGRRPAARSLHAGRAADPHRPRAQAGAPAQGGRRGARRRSPRAPGDRLDRERRGGDADRHRHRLERRRRATAHAPQRHHDRGRERQARDRELRRRRARALRLLPRRGPLEALRDRGRAPGHPQAQRRRRARGDDDGRARSGLAGHPPARGGRARSRGRLQPQGSVRVRGPRRAEGAPPSSSPSSTTARSRTVAARSTSTTRARRRDAPSSSSAACCAGTCRTSSTRA